MRIWLPDRPGALGQVASRIGALRGDVTGIDILERGGGRVVDELVVSLPDGSEVDFLLAEIAEVDGVAVEDIRRVDSDRPDVGLAALEIAARLSETGAGDRLEQLCRELIGLVDGQWVVALHLRGPTTVTSIGVAPDQAWLGAFLDGSRHLSGAEQIESAPGDLAWARLPTHDLAVAVGRSGRPFHTRERQQVALLGRLTDALLGP